jgi:hypothetical protein
MWSMTPSKSLPLDGGTHAGPLFVPLKRRPARVRGSGGAEVWAKYKKATPPWADRAAIRAKWEESKRMTAATEVQHSVDHIVPLVNPIVCGLHVEWNLRVVPLAENVRKSNFYWPDMPFEQLTLL